MQLSVCCSVCVSVSLAHVSVCVCVCQVEELTTENTQLRERVELLEKLLDIKKQDGQLFSKIVNHVNSSVLQLACKVLLLYISSCVQSMVCIALRVCSVNYTIYQALGKSKLCKA